MTQCQTGVQSAAICTTGVHPPARPSQGAPSPLSSLMLTWGEAPRPAAWGSAVPAASQPVSQAVDRSGSREQPEPAAYGRLLSLQHR
jgi:hypothetical protein